MARPYAREMARLPETFEWAASIELGALRQAVRSAGLSPLRAIGSGGSLTAAHALASIHQHHTSRIAAVATPLEAIGEALGGGVSQWLLSAGGGNVDIMAAARAQIYREPRQLAVLCGREGSPLAKLCRAHPFVDLLVYPPPAGKDGFLATNSLLGFTALLARAYAAEFGEEADWRQAVEAIRSAVGEETATCSTWEAETDRLWTRPTTLVLHGPATRIGAVDLESKFTEAAIGNLQLADYRNFAHGRHHWLAKRGNATAVLAFITEEDRELAERTLDLIPPCIPQARLLLPGRATAAGLLSIVAALQITGWAGFARGIDPGQPGVPEFGRKLYSLPLPRQRRATRSSVSDRDAAAITRKAGVAIRHLAAAGELSRWQAALDLFRDRLVAARIAGIVFDYDGTIVDIRHRFSPPTGSMRTELVRLLEGGARLAVATGRGGSVRRDLQSCLPPSLWDRVLVGYYNGAEIARLDDNNAPNGCDRPCKALCALAAALRAQPELAHSAKQTDRRFQITLEAIRVLPESRLWDLAYQVILMVGAAARVSVTRSSHSVDIVANGVSKLNVVARLRDEIGDAQLLTIGDRGRWPGNDYELLREPLSLGVDEISVDLETCWNLSQPGQRGPAATLEILAGLSCIDGSLCFREGSLR